MSKTQKESRTVFFFQILATSFGSSEAFRERICHGANRRRRSLGLLLPEGLIFLTYTVPMWLLTHSLNALHTHIKHVYFLFHFHQFSVASQAIVIQETASSRTRAGWKEPSALKSSVTRTKKKSFTSTISKPIYQRWDAVVHIRSV